jgi:hypothetical protein
MPNLHSIAFLGTAIALSVNAGQLLANEVSPESSLQNLVGSSVEIASQTFSETTDSNLEPLALESTTPHHSQEIIQQQPQTLSEAQNSFPSTQAADLSQQNWMDQVEWNIAQNPEQFLPVTQQPEATEKKPEDPRKAADANGRRLSNNYNYVGLGGNIGITGDGSGLGGGALMTLSKTGFSENFSLHSSGVVIGSDSASLVHLTADFPVRSETNAVRFSPFVGAGIIYKDIFNNDFSVGPSAVAGIDIPISYSFLITGRATVGYIREETDFGIQVGFSYIYTKGLLGLIFD